MAAVVILFLLAISGAYAADPELVADFAANSTQIDAGFFTFTGFRNVVNAGSIQFLVRKASVSEFPALENLGVSIAMLSFLPGAVNPPHTHPRGTEVLFLQEGTLTVGLVDSTNKLFVQTLQKGDVFVFPRSLVHFQVNSGTTEAKAHSSFSSSNAGAISLPSNLFNSNIDDEILSKAFKVSPNVIRALKSGVSIQ